MQVISVIFLSLIFSERSKAQNGFGTLQTTTPFWRVPYDRTDSLLTLAAVRVATTCKSWIAFPVQHEEETWIDWEPRTEEKKANQYQHYLGYFGTVNAHTTKDALDANAGPFMPFTWLRKLHSKFCFWVARPYRFVAPGPNTCRELRVAVCCRMQEESNSEDDGKDRGVPLVLLFVGNQNRNVLFQQLKWLASFFWSWMFQYVLHWNFIIRRFLPNWLLVNKFIWRYLAVACFVPSTRVLSSGRLGSHRTASYCSRS